jgi:hypothetical protein
VRDSRETICFAYGWDSLSSAPSGNSLVFRTVSFRQIRTVCPRSGTVVFHPVGAAGRDTDCLTIASRMLSPVAVPTPEFAE